MHPRARDKGANREGGGGGSPNAEAGGNPTFLKKKANDVSTEMMPTNVVYTELLVPA